MKNLIVIISILFSVQAMASHIVGGELYYDCLGNDNYQITLKLYRDCNSTGAQFDSPLPLSIFNGNGNLINTENVPYPGSTLLPVIFNNPCVTPPSNICVQEAIYTSVINLPGAVGGYTLSYQRCCRGPNVVNLINPDDTGITLTTKIPGIETTFLCNSSPRFTNYPPLLLCNNEDLIFDHSAIDPDGDDLVYSLCPPFQGGTSVQPAPNPASAPPYNNVVWEAGFSTADQLGTVSSINIDPVTGLLTADPNLLGLFAVGICVQEYRGGVLVGETRRDFLFRVVNCVITLSAEITEQEDLATFVSYCQGLTVEFENQSFGGSWYKWNFGVDGVLDDTSNVFAPTFTYPAEGIYDVTLIVNPGWPCSDTSIQTFEVRNELNVFFPPLDSQCIIGNSFDFNGQGDYQPGATFNWDFGTHANPETATTESVPNVVFDSSGFYPVTFTANWFQCANSYTDSVFIYREPSIGFGIVNELQCAPYLAEFKDSSLSDAPITYLWDFGDGNTSTESNPSHLYLNPGVYDVSLNIQVTEGCPANLDLIKPGLIDVKPSPISQFDATPLITDAFHTEIFFTDESSGGIEHFYVFNDSVTYHALDTSYNVVRGGYHYPYQVVINEWGCRDSSYQEIYVIPYTTLYVPNAFTPDGDGINDVFIPVILDEANYEFWIYNRWGEEIFYTTNPKAGWTGQMKGKDSPVGVYVWKVRFLDFQKGFMDEKIGQFSLIR